MEYFFYILFSKTLNKYYSGYSQNPEDRLQKHNTNHKGFTGKVNDWKIILLEKFQSKSEAIEREKQIKSWKNRNRIDQLIKSGSDHPD
jgi:putative endonuclease